MGLKKSLSDRIVLAMDSCQVTSASDHEVTNMVYGNCMMESKPGNGIKVANVRMSANRDPRLKTYAGHMIMRVNNEK